MELSLILQTSVFVSTIILVSGGSLIIPPEESDPFIPICTSYSGLCHIAYNVTEARGQIWHSHGQVCRCPGQQSCPIEWDDMENSIIKVFKNEGQEMEVKISYCNLNQPEEICRFNSPAVILRGDGPFHFEVFGDFKCKCNRRLYAHRSWRLGDYSYVEYSCGKPRCIINHSDNTCLSMTYQPEQTNILTEYNCRCRRHEECIAQRLPTPEHPRALQTCQPFSGIRG